MKKVATCLVLTILIFSACKKSNITGPDPLMIDDVKISKITQWDPNSPLYPHNPSVGEFYYDESGNLIKFDFTVHYSATHSQKTIYKEFKYEGDHLQWIDTYAWFFDRQSYVLSAQTFYEYDQNERVSKIITKSADEKTDDIWISTHTYSYDNRGRVLDIDYGDGGRLVFEYDESGNIIRSKKFYYDAHTFTSGYTYTNVYNPVKHNFPPNSGINTQGILQNGSPYILKSFKNFEPGKDPVSEGELTNILIDSGNLPTRIEYSMWNTTDPDEKIQFITEIEYQED